MTGQKLPGYRFPLAIGYAVWLYHRFTLSYRDVEELLLERGIVVTRESIRSWCITFSDLFAHGLRHREPRRGSRWSLDEMHVDTGGVKHWLWRAVDEHGAVLDVFLQEHRDTEAAKSFFHRLLREYDVPEVIHTDKLWSYGAALRESPVLHGVEHVQVVSTDRCNNLIEQSHRPTRQQERQQRGFRSRKRAQGFLSLHTRIMNLHHPARSTVPARYRRHHRQAAFKTWQETVWQAA
ncbi:IS6 family transposase [Deinococcus multiflagellatus]|uniref:IS6 family transposase n=1 Tax=Deinococcus multiflagellatus TaxID=1656887 RepID=A0ABW1ZT90_9DEIO|nr:IS6 family transposase [Deinococcus multiflagellatus]MBZ9716131.1 IS6 family transposase [Deinococcus multiflagellatus]